MTLNRIVTLGFGTSRGNAGVAGPITMGYGGLPQFVIAALTDFPRRRAGQSGTKRRIAGLEEVVVWARLAEINGIPPEKEIKGFVKVVVQPKSRIRTTVEHLSSRVMKVTESILVTVKRLK